MQKLPQLKTKLRQPPHLRAAQRRRFLHMLRFFSMAGGGKGSMNFRKIHRIIVTRYIVAG
jgi:hypothetical protein